MAIKVTFWTAEAARDVATALDIPRKIDDCSVIVDSYKDIRKVELKARRVVRGKTVWQKVDTQRLIRRIDAVA